jgi:hypothetical protein
MRGQGRVLGRFGVGIALACLLAASFAGFVRAQDAGWYGPYDDGCYHWWDGFQWTSDLDCNADGYADTPASEYPAGWYGPYDDGCDHWWDGYRWSGDVDCDHDGYTDSPTYPAGWYGPFEDGCRYRWDGSRYTGEADCDGDGVTDQAQETYEPGWYDVYGDGCRYWYDGSAYTGDIDCDGDGTSDTSRQPDNIETASVDRFIEAQVAAINAMWAGRFDAQGMAYSNTRAVLAAQPVDIGCPTKDGDTLLETEDWIFYCPLDETIYFGPGNLELVVQSGIGSVQFAVAHEIGHHVQNEVDPNFWTKYTVDTVPYEDQATCMAGIWFRELDRMGTPSDINEAMTYLSKATSTVHGSGQGQVAALLKGYNDPNSC